MSESQRVVNVIRQAIDQTIGEQIIYTPGVVLSVESNTTATRYIGATLLFAQAIETSDETSEGHTVTARIRDEDILSDIILPAGMWVKAGDFVSIALSDSGKAWIDRILPTGIFAMMVVNPNTGNIGLLRNEAGEYDFGSEGYTLKSHGEGIPMTWEAPAAPAFHDEMLTDGNGNLIFYGGDVIIVTGVITTWQLSQR